MKNAVIKGEVKDDLEEGIMKITKKMFIVGVLLLVSLGILFLSMAVVERMWPSGGLNTWLNRYSDFILDGSGGTILAGVKGTTNYDIYVQKIDSSGRLRWMRWRNGWGWGKPVCTARGYQNGPSLISYDSGAIVVWADARGTDYDKYGQRNYDIYAQRINNIGNRLWRPLNGKLISDAVEDQIGPVLISDGSGGAIIVWQDYRNGDANLYAQRINGDGVLLWEEEVLVCTAIDGGRPFQVISDGIGGAIITWQVVEGTDSNIYAQKIDIGGFLLWGTTSGLPICTAEGDQTLPFLAPDGNGGAIITWEDQRFGLLNTYVYAQHMDGAGNSLWNFDGLRVCTNDGKQGYPYLISDGNGGAIVAWIDSRNFLSTDNDIYVQRIDAEGNLLWDSSGVLLCNAEGGQHYPRIAPYGSNTFIVVWEDERGSNIDIVAQAVDSNGRVLWDSDGIPVCTSRGDQRHPEILPDGIIKWEDSVRNRTYVQKISYVSDDIDEDGLPNEVDPDDDGDGFRDGYDPSGDTTRASGVVACYEFNNARDVIPGTSIPDLGFDSSGNNNILTNVNGVESVLGRYGNGVRLTAANESYLYISTEGQNGLHITGDMTVSAWIKVNGFPRGVFIIAARQTDNDALVDYTFIIDNDGSNRLASWNGSSLVYNGSISLDSWHHVAFVRSGNQITFYLDGEEIGSSTQEFPNTVEDAPFFVGSNSGASVYANGEIDELAVYNRALTPTEISEFGT